MLTMLRIVNVLLLLAMVGCVAGALAGLIVLLPVVGGAWFVNLMALVGYEESARPGWIERTHALQPVRRIETAAHASPSGAKRAA
jgi:hypothetical protein